MKALLPLVAVCLFASCTQAPAEQAAGIPASEQPPNAHAPTVEELQALFYKMAPEHEGKELVVRYHVGPERVWKEEPQANGASRVWREPTGRIIGHASVNTAEFYRERAEKGPRLGGGTLRVRFELATGVIIGRPLRDK